MNGFTISGPRFGNVFILKEIKVEKKLASGTTEQGAIRDSDFADRYVRSYEKQALQPDGRKPLGRVFDRTQPEFEEAFLAELKKLLTGKGRAIIVQDGPETSDFQTMKALPDQTALIGWLTAHSESASAVDLIVMLLEGGKASYRLESRVKKQGTPENQPKPSP